MRIRYSHVLFPQGKRMAYDVQIRETELKQNTGKQQLTSANQHHFCYATKIVVHHLGLLQPQTDPALLSRLRAPSKCPHRPTNNMHKIPIFYILCLEQVSDQLTDLISERSVCILGRFHCLLCLHCVIIVSDYIHTYIHTYIYTS